MADQRKLAFAASSGLGLLFPALLLAQPDHFKRGPCVVGASRPTLESSLARVQQEPFWSAERTVQRFNVAYPHRRAELLVFPRRREEPIEAERASWSSLWDSVDVRRVRFDPAVPMYHIQFDPDVVLEEVADKMLREAPGLIKSIEANSCVFPQQQRQPLDGADDHESGRQWGHRTIDIEEAWKLEKGKSSVIAAVIDSGINHQHPDLACNFWDNPCDIANQKDDACPGHPVNGLVDDVHGWNFWDHNNQLFDNADHGTMIAGIIGACANTTDVVGLNWSVSLMDLRVYDTVAAEGALDAILSAFRYAVANGAHVINLSVATAPSEALWSLIDDATDIVVIAAAGDEGADGSEIGPDHWVFPCSWAFDNLICVTSSTEEDKKANSANYGPFVHLAAPGVKILSTEGSSIGERTGTSFAAPYVTGVAALVRARFPSETASQIVARVLDGDDISSLDGKTKRGQGLGTGRRLNACKALGCAAPPTPLP